jgi:glycosyltransferase involved in cell wall biosynthesis
MEGRRNPCYGGAVPPPTVSVMVLCYNHARYVSRCLDSIAATGWAPLELLVMDDASSDNSIDVIRGWSAANPDIPLRLVAHEANRGLTPTLNEACRSVCGQVLIPVSADDELAPDGIRVRVDYLTSHPTKLAVFADSMVIDSDGQVLHSSAIEGLFGRTGVRKRDLLDARLLPYALVFTWGVPGPVIALRSGFSEVIGPYDESLSVEDWDLYLRLAAPGALGFVDEVVSRYRVHSANLSATADQVIGEHLAVTAAKNAHLYRGLLRARLRVLGWQAPRAPGAAPTTARRTASRVLTRLLRWAYLGRRAELRRRSPLWPEPGR